MNRDEFRQAVKELRKEGVTQQHIADKLGFHISSIERAMSLKWQGDCKRIYKLFKLTYNKQCKK